MRKYTHSLILLAVLMILASCSVPEDEHGPTGRVGIQDSYLYYNDALYISKYQTVTLKEEPYLVGEVLSVTDNEIPDEEFEAYDLEIGWNVYLRNEDESDELLVKPKNNTQEYKIYVRCTNYN